MMDLQKFFLFRSVFPAFEKGYETPPAKWAGENIRFSAEGSPIKGNLDLQLSPFMVDPLNAWQTTQGQGLKEITIVAPEQMGKTTMELSGLLWFLTYHHGLTMIVYPSDEKGVRVNEEKLEPLMRNIPHFAEKLAVTGSKTVDCYRLGGNLIYFGGAGSRATSHTAIACLADEVDDWLAIKGVDVLNDLRKRSRAYSEAVLCAVCTPRMGASSSRIWKEFLRGSQGFWHLRCVSCGGLTMRSADVRNLQWECDADGQPVEESIRLICPVCGHEHTEADKRRMNLDGGYIHKYENRLTEHPSFQFGALASQFQSLRWAEIARSALLAGKSGDISSQVFFDNSIRGLPFQPRKLSSKGIEALKKHCAPAPVDADILYRFLAVDTQDAGFYWVVRGIDARLNSYLLGSGFCGNLGELEAIWDTPFAGRKLTCGIVDEGGHRAGEVRDFTSARNGLFTYKGNSRIGKKWKESEEIKGLILANHETYKNMLLYNIFASTPSGSHYWYLPTELTEMYTEQLTSYHENKAVKNGDDLENYISDGNDHLFDCEKMMLVMIDYFTEKILPMLIGGRKKVIRRSNDEQSKGEN